MAPSATKGPSRFSEMPRLSGILLVAVLLLLWECSAHFGWTGSDSWPPVSLVFMALVRGICSGELVSLMLATLRRVFLGYGLGCSIGIMFGLLLGVNRWLRYALKPLVDILRPLPAPAIVPPLILFLGVDDTLKVSVVALACFFPTFLNTLAGVEEIDDVLLQTARTFRISPMRTLVHVIFPATLPRVIAGLRIATGIALVVTIMAEMIAGSSGLGYYIVQMQYAMQPASMYAAVLCLAIAGYLINRIVLALEVGFIPWIGK